MLIDRTKIAEESERLERKAASEVVLILILISTLSLAIHIQPVESDWAWTETIYIRADGNVEPDTAPISTVDYVTYSLTDNIVGDVPYGTCAIVVERDNIVVDGAHYTVQSTESGTGIDLSYRSNVTIENVSIKNFGNHGIHLYHSRNNTLTNNTISNNYEGIFLSEFSNNNVITSNNLSANSNMGLYIYYESSSNVVTSNNVSKSMAGIQLQISSDNVLVGNIISDNYDGIRVTSSSNNNVITGNIVSTNQDRGISLHYSRDNTFASNTISRNLYGIYAFYFSRDNTFFHNNLLNNTFQAYAEWNVNIWDDGYPSGGNYWSDYAGVDANSDGIGDSPYVIDERNQDRYPLMNPWRERTVGVKVGDWAKYSVDTSWMGFLDPRLEMLSETEWGMIEVTKVQGTVITFTGTSRFKNGSELTAVGAQWDVAPTGSFGFIFWFISSNLQAKDKVYPSGAVAINETVTRTYCGVPRENNHLNGSTSGSIVPGPPYDINKLDCYWDQVTGILTEELLEASTVDLSSTLSIHLKMVDTNLWETPIPTTVNDLKTKIEELGSEGEIDNQGIVRSLIAKMNSAQKLIDKEKIGEAVMVLEGFITQVQELSEIHTTAGTADILIESAEYIISHL